jgi:mitochondrial import inner membrane translocase subunit TIM10
MSISHFTRQIFRLGVLKVLDFFLCRILFITLSLSRLKDLFNKIAASCFQKCTSAKHREPDLTLGEMTCTDRCVSKYLECQERIGGVLQKANEAQIAQQQTMVDMQQRMK